MVPLILIIVPIYLIEQYINKCIDSILGQSYTHFILLLIDDGSSDGCPTICDEYAKKDERVIVIHKKNGGLSNARNVGLDFANNIACDYIAFIDGDDWLEKDFLKTLVNTIVVYDVDIVCASFFYGSSIHFHKNTANETKMDSLEATRLLLKDETVQSHAWSKLYKSSLWKNYRFDETVKYMEDQCTTYKVFYEASKIYISNYAGYHYRQDNSKSLTKSTIDNKKVISGLKGYYYPCLYDGFKKKDRDYLLPSIHNALVNAYLMLIPYYKARLATDDEKAFIKELKKYIKDNKLIKLFVPNGKNNMIKKRLYRMCPLLYSHLFKLAKIIK